MLAPCPFCLEDDLKFVSEHSQTDEQTIICVECVGCGARGPSARRERDGEATAYDRINAGILWNIRKDEVRDGADK